MASLLAGCDEGLQGRERAKEEDVDACRAFVALEPIPPRIGMARTAYPSASLACLDGAFEAENLTDLIAWAETAERPTLYVRSGGGDAAAAIRLAEAMQQANGRVVVTELCASSCANYLYAGVSRRTVDQTTALLFHGGFTPSVLAQAMASLEQLLADNPGLIEDPEAERLRNAVTFEENRQRQDALLTNAGVDLAVVYDYEQFDLQALDPSRCTGPEGAPRNFVFYGAEDVRRLGLAPASGRLANSVAEVGRTLAAFDAPYSVCLAP